MRSNIAGPIACLAVASIVACKAPERESARTMGQPQMAATPTMTERAGGMATRTEPQAYLDSAEYFLARKNMTAAATALENAAPVMRMHAMLPLTGAADQLRTSAQELDSLATQMKRGTRMTPAMIHPALVRANLAEAEHHRSQAAVAWARSDSVTTGEELVMSADHFERALKDASATPSAATRKMIADAHATGGAMATMKPFAAATVDSTLGALESAIRSAPKIH